MELLINCAPYALFGKLGLVLISASNLLQAVSNTPMASMLYIFFMRIILKDYV